MRQIIVINHVTLDGVMQAPGHPGEDTRGGFAHGGWAAAAGSDEQIAARLGEWMGGGHELLLGRRSYEGMLSGWNERGGPFKDALNATAKHVASRSAETRLAWPNSTLLHGDVPGAVAELKRAGDANLVVMGSGELIGALMAAELIDVFVLVVHPLVLGTGRRLFDDGGPGAELRLTECVTAATGALLTTYERA